MEVSNPSYKGDPRWFGKGRGREGWEEGGDADGCKVFPPRIAIEWERWRGRQTLCALPFSQMVHGRS